MTDAPDRSEEPASRILAGPLPPPKLSLKGILWLGMGMLAGVFLTFALFVVAGVLAPDSLETEAQPLPVYVAAAIALFGFYVAICVHELGHLLGGKLVGLRFTLLVVGPMRWTRTGESLRFTWEKRLLLSCGFAQSVPDDERLLRERMMVMVAGGPAASLLFGLFSAKLWFNMPVPLEMPAEVLRVTFSLLTVLSITFFLLTILPYRTKGISSDGSRLFQLARGGARAERWCHLARLSAFVYSPEPPSRWSEPLLRQILALQDGGVEALQAQWLAYYWALDSGDLAAAERFLEEALPLCQIAPLVRPALHLEAAYVSAAIRNQPVLARRWFSEAQGGALIEPYTRLRAEAAVLLAENRRAEASAAAEKGLKLIGHRHESSGFASLEHRLLTEVLQTP